MHDICAALLRSSVNRQLIGQLGDISNSRNRRTPRACPLGRLARSHRAPARRQPGQPGRALFAHPASFSPPGPARCRRQSPAGAEKQRVSVHLAGQQKQHIRQTGRQTQLGVGHAMRPKAPIPATQAMAQAQVGQRQRHAALLQLGRRLQLTSQAAPAPARRTKRGDNKAGGTTAPKVATDIGRTP